MPYSSYIYWNPEDFGLSVVGEIQWTEPCCDFDLTVLWRDATGKLYWGDDSGCSCPMPFEAVKSLDDLETGSFHQFAEHVNARLRAERDSGNDYAAAQVVELLAKVRS